MAFDKCYYRAFLIQPLLKKPNRKRKKKGPIVASGKRHYRSFFSSPDFLKKVQLKKNKKIKKINKVPQWRLTNATIGLFFFFFFLRLITAFVRLGQTLLQDSLNATIGMPIAMFIENTTKKKPTIGPIFCSELLNMLFIIVLVVQIYFQN